MTGIIILLEYEKCGADNVIKAVHLPPAAQLNKGNFLAIPASAHMLNVKR